MGIALSRPRRLFLGPPAQSLPVSPYPSTSSSSSTFSLSSLSSFGTAQQLQLTSTQPATEIHVETKRPLCRRFPAELFMQILSDVDVSDDGFLWLSCRPVCHDFKIWVEEIYYRDYVPTLKLHTLVRNNPIPLRLSLDTNASTSAHNGTTSNDNKDDIINTYQRNPSFRDPLTTTPTDQIPTFVFRHYRPSSIPHLDPSKVIFELVRPITPPSNDYTTNATNGSTTNGYTTNGFRPSNSMGMGNSFHHFTRAASSLCGPYSHGYIGYYAVRHSTPFHYPANRTCRRLHYFYNGTPARTEPSTSALNARASLPDPETRAKFSLPIMRSDFAGRVAVGEFLEVDWRTLVGQSCRVREMHWLVDRATDLRDSVGNREESRRRARVVHWCSYGGFLGEV